jgi:NAD(P)-dependent dehydrogenase (short-subunit alcohol dehydrogenase family)
MVQRILSGLKFYVGFAPKFSRLGFEHKRLGKRPVEADFSGQSWLVTGASGGIGREIAIQAARGGARIVAVARNAAKLALLPEAVDGSGYVENSVADLSLMRAVRDAVDQLAAASSGFDVVVNNVGVLLNQHAMTDEGFETSFATNLLGHYLLTESLIARKLLAPGSLVINMSSGGMYSTPLLPEHLNIADPRRHDGVMAYARHKRAQVELTHHWNERHGPDILFHVMHPGWVDTEGVETSLPGFRRVFGPILRTPEQGADTAIWLAAERPNAAPEGIWLDRELQPEHVDDATRSDPGARQRLVAALGAWVRPFAVWPVDER